MIHKDTVLFLSQLKDNNNKEWFEKNKLRYKSAQQDILNFVNTWIKVLANKYPEFADINPKNCLFRINRDVRFSKNKEPYKINLGAFIVNGGKNSGNAGVYLHIEPNNCFFGAGKYVPESEDLSKIRQEIDYNFSEFLSIIENEKFKKFFPTIDTELKLQRPPKGYEISNPALEFLKLKSFTVFAKISENQIYENDFIKQIAEYSFTAMPFVEFLNRTNH